MKSILVSILLVLTSLAYGQLFTIDTIVEKSPYFPGDIYRFPIVNGRNDLVCQKINSHLINNFLDVDYGNQKKSIFENVWGNDADPYSDISELEFEYNLVINKVCVFSFEGLWCGAYCERFNTSFNYDLKTGYYIELDTLINIKSKEIVLQYLSILKRKRILNQITVIDKNLMSDSLNKDMSNHYKEAKRMFKECLTHSDYESFEYFDFVISKDSITLTSGRCSNHIDQPLDEIREFRFKFNITDIKKYLSPYGKELLVV